VVSAAIQALKDDAKLSSWVHTGLGIHQERKSEKCLFCDQALPQDRLVALEAHFSTEYEHLLRKLSEQIDTIELTIKVATDLSLSSTAELYDDL